MEKKSMGKKGLSLGDLAPLAITFVVVVIVVGIGASILSTVGATQTANSAAANATRDGNAGLIQISSYFPILGLVIVAAVVIGVLVNAFRT